MGDNESFEHIMAANNMGELYNISRMMAGSSMRKNVPIKDANGQISRNNLNAGRNTSKMS
jgi:hypothetical protein